MLPSPRLRFKKRSILLPTARRLGGVVTGGAEHQGTREGLVPYPELSPVAFRDRCATLCLALFFISLPPPQGILEMVETIVKIQTRLKRTAITASQNI